MTTPPASLHDALLRQALARRAAGPSTPAELLDDVLAAVETLPQRRGWTLPLVSELRLVPILLVAALLLSALIGPALFVGGRIISPHSNGLVAYESGGDIYVGDLATGETRAVVTSPAFEAHPIFSPDGTQIAFYRSPTRLSRLSGHDDWAPTTAIVVVRADGSGERIIVPAGFPGRALGAFSWTPDGAYLIVNTDVGRGPSGGLVFLFDASGGAEPRLLTPPLPRWVGGHHPQTASEVAAMFRPPNGDRVLSFPDSTLDPSNLVEMDIDGSNHTVLLDPARTDLPFQAVEGAIWSPGANLIALTTGDICSPCFRQLDWSLRTYVMSADGGELRRLTRIPDADPGVQVEERVLAWSPDGSMILIERSKAEDQAPIKSQTIVVEVATSIEHAIGSPTTWPYARRDSVPYLPTGSWSPDGQKVLVFEGPGTRPIVIDIETGASTELPWASDSHPSWRRTD